MTEIGSHNTKDIDSGCPTTLETTTPYPIHPRLIEKLRGLGEKTIRARGPACLLWGDRHNREAVPMKSQNYAYQNNTYIMTTLVNMPTCMMEISQDSNS